MSAGQGNADLRAVDLSVIPPPPTREQELDYLNRLEEEYHNRPFAMRYYDPNPERNYDYEQKLLAQKFRRDYNNKWYLGAAICAPLAIGIATILPLKASASGIPFRAYANQFKFRFWGAVIGIDFLFATYVAQKFQDHKTLYENRYPIKHGYEVKL